MTTMVGMSKSQRRYLPAAGRDLFLPLYDLIAKVLGADGARQTLFELAPLRPGDRVLDIGCGTGTFATMLKQRYGRIEVAGLDPDPKALARARQKAEHAECQFGSTKDLQIRWNTLPLLSIWSSPRSCSTTLKAAIGKRPWVKFVVF